MGALDDNGGRNGVGRDVGDEAVGLVVGNFVGLLTGLLVGISKGPRVGFAVGKTVACFVGSKVGTAIGKTVGSSAGKPFGLFVGLRVGTTIAPNEGFSDGEFVASLVGALVGGEGRNGVGPDVSEVGCVGVRLGEKGVELPGDLLTGGITGVSVGNPVTTSVGREVVGIFGDNVSASLIGDEVSRVLGLFEGADEVGVVVFDEGFCIEGV